MDRPRLTIGAMMFIVAIAAIDCGFLLVPTYLAGGYLIGASIHIALIPLFRSRGRFWIGFVAAGLLALAAIVLCRHVLNVDIAWWPSYLYVSYRDSLSSMPPALADWLLRHFYMFDPRGDLSVIQVVIVLEVTYGLPLLLLALLGGLVAASFRPQPPMELAIDSVTSDP